MEAARTILWALLALYLHKPEAHQWCLLCFKASSKECVMNKWVIESPGWDLPQPSSEARVRSIESFLFPSVCMKWLCQILSFIQPVGRTGFFSLSLLSLCEGLIPTIIGFRTLSCNLDKCTKQCRQKYCAILTNFDNFAHQPPTHLVLLLSSYFLSMEAGAKEQYRGSIHGVVAIETCSMFIVFCLVGQNLVKIENQIH